jgi:hypothetical protein
MARRGDLRPYASLVRIYVVLPRSEICPDVVGGIRGSWSPVARPATAWWAHDRPRQPPSCGIHRPGQGRPQHRTARPRTYPGGRVSAAITTTSSTTPRPKRRAVAASPGADGASADANGDEAVERQPVLAGEDGRYRRGGVRPAIPVVETTPPGVASPKRAARRRPSDRDRRLFRRGPVRGSLRPAASSRTCPSSGTPRRSCRPRPARA